MKGKVLHRCGEEMGDDMAMALLHKGVESFGLPWPRGHDGERRTGSYQCLTGEVSEQSEHLEGTVKAPLISYRQRGFIWLRTRPRMSL